MSTLGRMVSSSQLIASHLTGLGEGEASGDGDGCGEGDGELGCRKETISRQHPKVPRSGMHCIARRRESTVSWHIAGHQPLPLGLGMAKLLGMVRDSATRQLDGMMR